MGSWKSKNTGASDGVKLDMKEGETFEGSFLGSNECSGKHGAFIGHNLADEDGNPFFATGASLNNQFADVEPGTRIRVTYNGMKDTKSGRTVKDYEVSVYVEDEKASRGAAV